MANGDDAVAAGLLKVASSADRRQGYDEINRTRDYLVNRVQPVNRGGTGAGNAASARANLAVVGTAEVAAASTVEVDKIPRYNAEGRLVTNTPISPGHVANKAYVDASVPSLPLDAFFDNVSVNYHFYTPNASIATSGWTTAYINGDGRISRGASSRRFKKNIQEYSADQQAVLAMQLVTYQYRAELFDKDDPLRTAPPVEVGLIAEDLDYLGLQWLVVYDAEGRPDGIHYERIALALLPIVQSHDARLTALEAALTTSAPSGKE